MAVAPAQQWGNNWSAGVSGAQQKYTDGIRNTTVDVAGRAVASQGALLANFTQAVTSGEWARRLLAVGTQGWKTASEAKAANYATGASAGKPKYDRFAQQAQPTWSALSDAIGGMASGSRSAALARINAWLDGMDQFKSNYTP